jgi:hypothetical protein
MRNECKVLVETTEGQISLAKLGRTWMDETEWAVNEQAGM